MIQEICNKFAKHKLKQTLSDLWKSNIIGTILCARASIYSAH